MKSNSNKSKYFLDAQEAVRENDFLNFDDEAFSADDTEAFNAQGRQSLPTSKPLIVVITNTTTDNITDAEIFNAYGKHDSFAVTGASLASGISGVNYRAMLYDSITNPFLAGSIRMSCSNTSQVTKTFSVTSKNTSGKVITEVFFPLLNSFQQITTQTDTNYEFMVDGYTAITISTLLASAALTIYVFPSRRVRNVNGLSSGNQTVNYANPQLNSMGIVQKALRG